MKHAIYPEKQGTPTADSEDGAYPATNLIDNHRKKVWKAVNGVQTAELTIPISAGSSVIALFNTNATSATVEITDDGDSSVIYSGSWTIDQGRYWQEYTAHSAAHTAVIELTTGETTLECGVVRAGTLLTIGGAKPGISESIKDFSIKKPLRNGAYYTKKLNMVRVFSYSVSVQRESVFRNLMSLYEYYGPDPFAMLLLDGTGADDIWAVFGCFDGVPGGSHNNPAYSDVSISIEEVV